MRIINSHNPAHGFADFVLVCDYCGLEIGEEDANLEFYDQGRGILPAQILLGCFQETEQNRKALLGRF